MTDTTPDSQLVVRAAAFAAHAHRSQRRKSEGDIPYINHPLEVAQILVETAGVSDPEVLAAAILHDTVEDTEVMPIDLITRFGSRVATLVDEVTDDKSLPKKERKRLQIEHAPHMTWGAKLIKLADKTHNVYSIATKPPLIWGHKRIVQYIDWAEEVVSGLRGTNTALEALFDERVALARDKFSEQQNTEA